MDFVDQLKSSVDIVKVIGEYVRLERKSSTGSYSGLCPFHQEKTPSFSVHQPRQFYKCFGCGASGDVLKFVMEHDGLTFPETLQYLSERFGIPMPKKAEYSNSESKLRAALMEMHTIAAAVFRENLKGPQGGEARAYLNKRGLSQELIDVFELGFADTAWDGLLRRFAERQFTHEQLEASGLIRKRNESTGHFDNFRGRLMFPIHNESGKVIAFGGRSMRDEDQPKYLNSPETPIYRKTSVLYNLNRARDGMRKNGRVVVVEGYMDVIGVYAAGVKEVVASCGTALTNPQVRAIHRHADAVVLNFDSDTAGENAAERAIQVLLDEGLNVRVLTLNVAGGGEGSKLDPYEFVKQFGADAYVAKLDGAGSYFHWLADRARVKFDMRGSEGRVAAFKFLMPSVLKVPDKLERAAVANDLAGYLGVDRSLVLPELKKSSTEQRQAPAQAAPKISIPAVERILLSALLTSERAQKDMLPELTASLTSGFVTAEIFDGLRHVLGDGETTGTARVFSALEARLSEASRELLHGAVAADDKHNTDDEEAIWVQAEACLRRLQSDERRKQVTELRLLIKTAEREGRVADALSLMRQLSQLEQQGGRKQRE
ncbi:MAG: DNA primase [Acidobacteriota bacterium]